MSWYCPVSIDWAVYVCIYRTCLLSKEWHDTMYWDYIILKLMSTFQLLTLIYSHRHALPESENFVRVKNHHENYMIPTTKMFRGSQLSHALTLTNLIMPRKFWFSDCDGNRNGCSTWKHCKAVETKIYTSGLFNHITVLLTFGTDQ